MDTNTSVKELLGQYNLLAEKPLTSWKSGKDKLIAKIAALTPKTDDGRKRSTTKVHGTATAADEFSSNYKAAVAAAAISPRDSIQVASEKLLEATAYEHDGRKWGLPYAAVLAEVQRVFPDCKTTIACLRWYAVRMNEAGTRLPKRKRSKS